MFCFIFGYVESISTDFNEVTLWVVHYSVKLTFIFKCIVLYSLIVVLCLKPFSICSIKTEKCLLWPLFKFKLKSVERLNACKAIFGYIHINNYY